MATATAVKSTGLTAAQTATLSGIVNSSAANQQAYSTGKATSATPTATANPHDALGYNPATDPLSSAYGKTATPTTPVNTSQPTPTSPQAQVNPPVAPIDTTAPAGGNAGVAASPEQIAAVQKATKDVQNLQQQYQQGLANAKASGATPPNTSGAASSAVEANTPPPPQGTPTTTPNVDNYFNPQTNPALQQSTQDLMDFINPPAVRDDLISQMTKIQGEQNTLASEQLQLMDVKRVMSGTADDLRSEIQAVGGFGTESQVQALVTARNKTLLKQATFIQDQMTYQQNLIANDTTLLNFEKDMANTQATQRMGILQYQQTNQNNIMNAARDRYKTLISSNPSGLYNALISDPQQAANFQAITGMTPQMLQGAVSTSQLDAQYKQAQIVKIYSDMKTTNQGVPLTNYLGSTSSGNQYLNYDTLTASEKGTVANQARVAGIPVVDKATVGKLNAIDETRDNLSNIGDSIKSLLASQGGLNITRGINNSLAGLFGDADVKSYNAYRTAIINSVQALAGGAGSGLRINAAEIKTAMENDLPVVSGIHADTLQSANAKLDKLKTQLDNWENILVGKAPANQNNQNSDYTVNGQTYSRGTDGLYYKK